MDTREYDLAGRGIGCAMKVHSAFGPVFLESVYQDALLHELRKLGRAAQPEVSLTVNHDGVPVGHFQADLTATGLDEGLWLNFGAPRLEYRKKFRVYRPAAESAATIQ